MTQPGNSSKLLSVSLWIVQLILALLFVGTGLFKLLTAVPKVAALWPWAGEYPALLRLTGAVDLLGGLGLILPGLLRRWPSLTAWAALGCVVLQVCAIAFHLARGEAANTPFNVVVLLLAAFVYWGRRAAR